MIKLLIVEDEPLVQIGIRSMLNWADLGIEVCGTSKDGIQGLEMMEIHSPDIVITDIKMPRMDGLEMMKLARERFGNLSAFIVLTSYEEFQLLKEAMKYDIIDYLIKLELNVDTLTQVMNKAIKSIEETKDIYTKESFVIPGTQAFYDKFFIKLLLNLFENDQQAKLQANELNLEFNATSYVVSHSEIAEYTPMWESPDKTRLLNLYSSTIQMIREVIKKYITCYVASLDTKRFSIIFCLNDSQTKNYQEIISEVLDKTFTVVHNYFNVSIRTSVGSPCHNTSNISEAYQDARQIFSSVTTNQSVLFYDNIPLEKQNKNIFNMSLFRKDIIKAFEEFDTKTLSHIFTQIEDIFHNHQTHYLQSIDAASNILYLAISMLPEGEETVSKIFSKDSDGYRSLYKQTNVEQVIQWLNTLKEGLCHTLIERRKNYKNHIVNNVKKYIDAHIDEKLTLNDISSIFGISPNYLSQLFKKYNDLGFTDYITHKKIASAKVLLMENNLKLYEIAEKLGFESSFYLSKVFKKVEGCSPREYLQYKVK